MAQPPKAAELRTRLVILRKTKATVDGDFSEERAKYEPVGTLAAKVIDQSASEALVASGMSQVSRYLIWARYTPGLLMASDRLLRPAEGDTLSIEGLSNHEGKNRWYLIRGAQVK